MARERIHTGIDIGTTLIQVATFLFPAKGTPRALAMVSRNSQGMRRGVIISPDELAANILEALQESSLQSGLKTHDLVMGVNSGGIRTQATESAVASARPDGEITTDDVERALRGCENVVSHPNREVVHVIPRSFSLERETGVWDPVGMKSLNLKAFAVVVEGPKNFLRALEQVSKIARLTIRDIVFNPLAVSEVVLSSHERELGTLLVDIGGSSTTYAVVEDGTLSQAGTIPFGSSHITRDIGLGFRVDHELAELIKKECATVKSKEIPRKEELILRPNTNLTWSKREVAEVIEARVREILEEVENELKRTGRAGLLPGGAVLYGGGSKLQGIEDIARSELRLPTKTAELKIAGHENKEKEVRLDFINACSLCFWSEQHKESRMLFARSGRKSRAFMRFLRSLLP